MIKVAIYVIWKITKIEGVYWINYFQQYLNLQLYYSYRTVTEGINDFMAVIEELRQFEEILCVIFK